MPSPSRQEQIQARLAELRADHAASRHLAWRWATVFDLPFTAAALRFACQIPEWKTTSEDADTSRGLWELVRSYFGARQHGGDCDDQAVHTTLALQAIRPDLDPQLEFLGDPPFHVRTSYRIGTERQSIDHTIGFPLAAR